MEIKDITKEAVVISDSATLQDALDRMLTAHTNTLLVTDEDGTLAGEVSVSDLFDGVVPQSLNGDQVLAQLADEASFAAAVVAAADTPVSDFMSADYDTVTPDTTIMEVASIAVAHGRARMPVVDHEGRPIGMISRQGLKKILGQYMGGT
jgi:CBS domain-containing protein